MFFDPLYIFAILILLIALSEWLATKNYFRYLGSALTVIILGAVVANAGLIPSSRQATEFYDGIFTYAAPLAIFYLLLDVKLKDIRQAGLPMIMLFLLGSLFSIGGSVAGYYIFSPQDHGVNLSHAVAGMYTGTYIGGSANLNAVGLQYKVNEDGLLYAAVNATDNIISAVWILVTIAIPGVLQKFFPRKRRGHEMDPAVHDDSLAARESVSVISMSLLLALGLIILLLSNTISKYFPQVPSILILTTLALILAQVPFVQKLKGAKVLGYFLILLFLAVIGVYCDIGALLGSGPMAMSLMIWVTFIVFFHGILLFTVGGLFRQDWDMIAIASNANIGGATTSGVLATTLGRPELRLPAILIGAIGNALGTYAGVAVAEWLRG